jgi:hypothetical protein
VTRYLSFALILALTATPVFALQVPPPQYDHPFNGRLIVEVLPYWQVRERCKGSWDIPRGGWAVSCSWHFDDPLNPGKQACHVVYPRIGPDWSPQEAFYVIREETANCNGWHDAEVREMRN